MEASRRAPVWSVAFTQVAHSQSLDELRLQTGCELGLASMVSHALAACVDLS